MSSNKDDDKGAWLREHIAMETDGERTPAQDPDRAPDEFVMNPNTPALLRRQAA